MQPTKTVRVKYKLIQVMEKFMAGEIVRATPLETKTLGYERLSFKKGKIVKESFEEWPREANAVWDENAPTGEYKPVADQSFGTLDNAVLFEVEEDARYIEFDQVIVQYEHSRYLEDKHYEVMVRPQTSFAAVKELIKGQTVGFDGIINAWGMKGEEMIMIAVDRKMVV